MLVKPCRTCGKRKHLLDYYKNRATQDGRQGSCKKCTEARIRHKRHGLSPEEQDALFDQQEGLCAICGEPCPKFPRLCIDHDHITGKIRGLLCKQCNLGLGNFRDSPEILEAAIAYLSRIEEVV